MRKTLLVLAMTAITMVLASGVALAANGIDCRDRPDGRCVGTSRDDNTFGVRGSRPPETVLKKGAEKLQEGRLGSYCWPLPSGYRCRDVLSPPFPAAAPGVMTGSTLRLRLREPERPDLFGISTYRKLDEDGFPRGNGRPLKVSLRRVVVDGRTVAWDALFVVGRPGQHYYLDAFGVWGDGTAACRDASWAFHVRVEGRR